MLKYFIDLNLRELKVVMIISVELAQKIVDQLMDIVQRNVNIMDCKGIIIASGQPLRINTFHQGGKLAVDKQTIVEIHPQQVQDYTGALPGVMWPIKLKEKIIGVVGVTGEPHEVRNTANLVKTVTELILDREIFLADYRSETQLKNQLVTLLFSENQDTVIDDINTLTEILNYKLNLPRIVILIQLEPMSNNGFATNGLQNIFSDRLRENILKMVNESTFFTTEDISLFYKKNLCIIKALPDHPSTKKASLFTTSIVTLLNSFQPKLKIKMGIGSLALHDSQLRQSYNEAIFSLKYPTTNIIRSFDEYEILLAYLFDNQCTRYSSCLALRKLKQKFDEIKSTYDMQKTLDCLLANNLNVSLTASHLFIHRNTLKFRLEKLKKIVGLEPCHFFQHAMLCKFLLSLDEGDVK